MKTSASIFRQTFVYTIFLALLLTLTAGCGSDSDSVTDLPPPTVPDQLNYEIRQGAGTELILTQNPSVTITSTLLTGTFNRISEAFTLDTVGLAMLVSADDFLADLDAALGDGSTFSDYNLHVLSPSSWTGDDNPTSGVFEIISIDGSDRIKVTVDNSIPDANVPGVYVEYIPDGVGDGDVYLSWQEFDAAFDNPGDTPYAAIASFGYSLLRFMYEQNDLIIVALEFIGENDVLLEESGPIDETCDTFPRPPVPVVPNPGTSTIAWSDMNTDNSVGPGDSFFLDFSNCWLDDEIDEFDTLYNGTIELANYTEVVSDGVITRVGFEPSSGRGGVFFTSLSLTETEDNGVNILIYDAEKLTINGSFSIVFSSP